MNHLEALDEVRSLRGQASFYDSLAATARPISRDMFRAMAQTNRTYADLYARWAVEAEGRVASSAQRVCEGC